MFSEAKALQEKLGVPEELVAICGERSLQDLLSMKGDLARVLCRCVCVRASGNNPSDNNIYIYTFIYIFILV